MMTSDRVVGERDRTEPVDERINVFTYGTLMYEPVWERVVGSEARRESATLRGYIRRRIKMDVYPVIFPGRGEVEGVLYFGLSDRDLVTLDVFEGGYYQRTQAKVDTESDGSVTAYTYVLKLEHFRLIGGEWSRAEFESNGLRRFMTRYEGFGKL
jgi:gamma-glutamylcyclotransferase (GGCT)/AIG2-like uncharacterized protein YtfP